MMVYIKSLVILNKTYYIHIKIFEILCPNRNKNNQFIYLIKKTVIWYVY